MNVNLLLIKNVLQPLRKSVLIPLELTAAASAADAGITKKIGQGLPSDLAQWTATLMISNEEMKDILKKVKPVADSGL